MAVITDRRLVKETVDKKSTLYNHRPPSFVSHDLITKGDHLLVMHYGTQWRTFRKLIHQHLTDAMVESQHLRIVNAEAVQLVRDYLLYPDDHMLHPKRFSNSISNSIIFGVRTRSTNGEYMTRLYHLMERWSAIMETGATPPVDIFPWLKLLPEKVFGSYVTRARSIGHQMETLYDEILSKVIARRESGRRLGSFMDKVLDQQKKNELAPNQLRFIGGVLMEGGSDTSSSLILVIIQAMIKYPAIKQKAQAEIDAVVGPDRSPQWSDLDNLPYINMIVKEGHRWRPILPLGFPHALGEDDWVDGQFLPKGTIIILNAWGMHMDEKQYENPAAFIPERFAEHSKLAPEYAAGDWEKRDHYGYGAGRRICPGIHLAERNMFLSIAKLLWAFSFEEQIGVDEKPLTNDPDPVTGYHQGFLYCPKPYGCKPVVRSDRIRATLMKEFAVAEESVFSEFEEG
ncbi:MAG: hypothetical protein LQ338_003653 [Usnochroma carphineum]|nr:MAG: hypothetical protein LQ338_003653 [Usnochroma carphineum]